MNIKEFTKGTHEILKGLEVDFNQDTARKLVDAQLELIKNTVAQGEKVSLFGFGDFEARERSARKGRNPKTGDEIDIAATILPKFKPAKAFKDTVKK